MVMPIGFCNNVYDKTSPKGKSKSSAITSYSYNTPSVAVNTGLEVIIGILFALVTSIVKD